MGAAIAIVRAAACGAMGADIAAMVDALRTDRSGVGPSDMLEQVPAVAAGVGEVPLGIRHGTHGVHGDTAREDASAAEGVHHDDRAEQLLRRTLEQLLGDDPSATIGVDPSRAMVVVGTTLAGMRHCGAAMRLEGADRATEALH